MLKKNKSLQQRLLSGGIWAFSAKLGTGFITIALTALVTRLLEPVDVGVLFLSFSIIIMISIIIRLGLDQLGVKLIGEALSERNYRAVQSITFKIITIVIVFSLICSTLIYFSFGYISIYFFSGKDIKITFQLLFSLWVFVTSLQIFFAEIFRAHHHISEASIFSGGTVFGGFFVSLFVGLSFLFLYFIEIKITLEIILAIIVSISSISLLIEGYLILKIFKKYSDRGTEGNDCLVSIGYTELVKQGLPFIVTIFSSFSLIHLDTIVLGHYRPDEEVAIYAATTRIVKIVLLFSMVTYEVVAPVIVELNTTNQKEKLEEMLRVVATLAAVPAAIILLFFIFSADMVLGYLYGEYYKAGASILVILSIAQFINVWTGLCGYSMSMMGYQRIKMYIFSSVTFVALIGCVIFAKEYGSIGVAYIIGLAWITQNILVLFFTRYLTGIWTHVDLFGSYKKLLRLLRK